MTDKYIFLTHDTALRRQSPMQTDVDRMVASGTGQLVPIKPEDIPEMARQAGEAFRAFIRVAERGMTLERAKQIKVWRCIMVCSWRRVAELGAQSWGRDARWAPPTNQLAGMALCEVAARRLGEEPDQPPWNGEQ